MRKAAFSNQTVNGAAEWLECSSQMGSSLPTEFAKAFRDFHHVRRQRRFTNRRRAGESGRSQDRLEQSLWAVHTDTPNPFPRTRKGTLRFGASWCAVGCDILGDDITRSC